MADTIHATAPPRVCAMFRTMLATVVVITSPIGHFTHSREMDARSAEMEKITMAPSMSSAKTQARSGGTAPLSAASFDSESKDKVKLATASKTTSAMVSREMRSAALALGGVSRGGGGVT